MKRLFFLAIMVVCLASYAPLAFGAAGDLKWSYEIPSAGGTYFMILSSPAIGPDGTIYVGADDHNLYAINPDGTLKWTFQTDGYVSSSPAIGSSPATTVYVGSENDDLGTGTLYAIDPSQCSLDTCAEKWSTSLPAQIVATPAVGPDGTVYIACIDGSIHAVDPSNGQVKWDYSTTTGTSYWLASSPVIGENGATLFVGGIVGNVYAINTADGSLKWKFLTNGSSYAVNSSPGIDSHGNLYVAVDDGYLYAIRPGMTDATLKWRAPITDDGTGSAVTDLACYSSYLCQLSSPAIGVDGTIYVGGNWGDYGALYAINPDGSEKWRQKLWTDSDLSSQVYPAIAAVSSPAVAADGTVYIQTNSNGLLYAVDSANGDILWTYPTSTDPPSGGESSPAIAADGTVYVGTEGGAWDQASPSGSLVAVTGTSGLANAPWPMFHHDYFHTGVGPVTPAKIGVFDSGYWYLDSNMSWAWDGTPTDTLGIFGIGLTGAVPVVGDWNGDGTTKIGVFMNGYWYLDMNRNWQWDGEPTDKMGVFGVGLTGAIPVVGDWNGDGTTKIGVFINGVWYLDMNNNWQWDGEPTDKIAYFGVGLTGAVPVVGDWNGDGKTKIGIYQNGYWYLDVNGNGQWDGEPTDQLGVFGIGLTNAVPVIGDWNADGIDEIGIYQQGYWYLDKNRSWQWEGEPTDQFGVFGIGLTGAVPVPGKW